MDDREPILSWNPKLGYTCSACDWGIRAHVGPNIPPDDEITQFVRKKFVEHVREKHPRSLAKRASAQDA